MDLSVRYLGLTLRSPLIVGPGPLTASAGKAKPFADAGVGAVVLRSLFEEQLRAETQPLADALASQGVSHAEAYEAWQAELGMRYGSREYLDTVRQAKETLGVPVIASINCVSAEWWNDFAGEVAAAGADAIELNLALTPKLLRDDARAVEDAYVGIVRAARQTVTLPLAVKLGPWFSSLPDMILKLRQAGANGFVLFNRFYQPTIDPDTLRVVTQPPWSAPGEHAQALRWIALLAGQVPADFCAGTGIHTGRDVIRLLLAGANAVQMVTALVKHGPGQVSTMLAELESWMQHNRCERIADFQGRLSQARNPEQELFSRLQYLKTLGGSG